MSRSYKKYPKAHYIKRDSSYKKIYNRRLRRTHVLDTISPHSKAGYKKLNDSYEIDDWACYVSWEEWWSKGKPLCVWNCKKLVEGCPQEKECYKCWEKFVLRK